jgi:hypothetical protein
VPTYNFLKALLKRGHIQRTYYTNGCQQNV